MELKARLRHAKPLLGTGQVSWQPCARLGTHKIDQGMCAQVLLPALRKDMERLAAPAGVETAEGEASRIS